MSMVRNINAVFVGHYDGHSICYMSQSDVTDVVLDFIERSEYKDAGFIPKVKVLETNPNNSWDRCHHIKVKNRVPYFIEISAFNPKSWCVTLYSKKPIKENGYSHYYLRDLFGELKDFIILSKEPYIVPAEMPSNQERIVGFMENFLDKYHLDKEFREMMVIGSLFMLWVGLIILSSKC